MLVPPCRLSPLSQPRVHREVDTVVVARVAAVVVRLAHEVVGLSELARVQVVEAADRVAAAVRQPRIDRRDDAERIVVRAGHGQVVGDVGEVLPPPAIVGDLDRHAGQHLVLHRDAELPVAGPHAPAAQDARVEVGGRAGAAERLIEPGAALAVHPRVHQVALRNVVGVRVGPLPVHDRRDALHGIREHEAVLVGGRREVLAEIGLHATSCRCRAGRRPRRPGARGC